MEQKKEESGRRRTIGSDGRNKKDIEERKGGGREERMEWEGRGGRVEGRERKRKRGKEMVEDRSKSDNV